MTCAAYITRKCDVEPTFKSEHGVAAADSFSQKLFDLLDVRVGIRFRLD